MKLTGHEVENKLLVTGCVVAVLGCEMQSGDFEVIDIKFPEYAPQHKQSFSPKSQKKFLAIISGISAENEESNHSQLQILQEFFNGEIGDSTDHQIASEISHLIIAGNLMKTSENKISEYQINENDYGIEKNFSEIHNKMLDTPHLFQKCDQLLRNLSLAVPISIMPGASDLSNMSLPQQPFHKSLFHSCEELKEFDSFEKVTNPYFWRLNGITILGNCGQPIDDMCKYMIQDDVDRIDLMNQTLRWRTIAPTAPDTLCKFKN